MPESVVYVCPRCGGDVPRQALECPHCGKEFYVLRGPWVFTKAGA